VVTRANAKSHLFSADLANVLRKSFSLYLVCNAVLFLYCSKVPCLQLRHVERCQKNAWNSLTQWNPSTDPLPTKAELRREYTICLSSSVRYNHCSRCLWPLSSSCLHNGRLPLRTRRGTFSGSSCGILIPLTWVLSLEHEHIRFTA